MESLFSLNSYLRRFVNHNLVDRYERRCINIVEKYKGQVPTKEVLEPMFKELNEALMTLSEEVHEMQLEEDNAMRLLRDDLARRLSDD